MSSNRDIRQPPAKALDELGKADNVDVEVVTNAGISGAADLEAFMHEPVEIFVHKGREKDADPFAVPNVNGINQPILRGQWIPVKRKYVEALARAHTITYEQVIEDASKPHASKMVPRAVPDYPFDVRDDSRRGKKWLDSIYASI